MTYRRSVQVRCTRCRKEWVQPWRDPQSRALHAYCWNCKSKSETDHEETLRWLQERRESGWTPEKAMVRPLAQPVRRAA